MIATPKSVPAGTEVFVNGKRMEEVFYADDRRGIVDCYRKPVRLDKYKKRILSKRYRGEVKIVLPDGYEGFYG